MSKRRSSLTRRALVQMDLAFWYLHAHFAQLAVLSAPMLIALGAIAVTLVAITQTWSFDGFLLYVIYGIIAPTLVLWVGIFLPLPSAVFAWRRASGSLPTTGECFRHCLGRSQRLMPVALILFVTCFGSFVFWGVPLLYFWPRMCAVPAIALFENERKIFKRSRRLLKEDIAINVLAGLYVGVFLALGFLLFLPRILLSSQGRLVATSASRWVLDYLWISEVLGGAILVTSVAVGWCISMTLLYREVRIVREGEFLREKLAQLQNEFSSANRNESALPA